MDDKDQKILVLVDALKWAVLALNTAPRFKVGDTDSYEIAAKCDRTIAKVEGSV